MVRILVVDGSYLMCWLVEHLAPRHVLVEQAVSFSEAQECLTRTPPNAAIFNITPCHLKWRLLISLCQRHDPPIPFICCTSLPADHELLIGLRSDDEGMFTKPLPIRDLRIRLRELIDRTPSLDVGTGPRHDRIQ